MCGETIEHKPRAPTVARLDSESTSQTMAYQFLRLVKRKRKNLRDVQIDEIQKKRTTKTKTKTTRKTSYRDRERKRNISKNKPQTMHGYRSNQRTEVTRFAIPENEEISTKQREIELFQSEID
jgi:hypothetical protein